MTSSTHAGFSTLDTYKDVEHATRGVFQSPLRGEPHVRTHRLGLRLLGSKGRQFDPGPDRLFLYRFMSIYMDKVVSLSLLCSSIS